MKRLSAALLAMTALGLFPAAPRAQNAATLGKTVINGTTTACIPSLGPGAPCQPIGVDASQIHGFRATSDQASVLDPVYAGGADPSGVVDSTSAFAAAAATGRSVYAPTGTYRIDGNVVLRNGQRLFGDGRTATVLIVSSATTHASGALGIVQLATSEPGASLQDIGISFRQPDQTSRANLFPFPPAIYAKDASRFQVNRVRVSGANQCLDATGNTGGAFVDDFECGALMTGMAFDGAFDFVHVANYHFWPFGFSQQPGLLALYEDSTVVAASIGRVDGFQATGWTVFYGRINVLADATFVHLNGLSLDSNGGALNIAGGVLVQVSNLYSTSNIGRTISPITQTGGVSYFANAFVSNFSSAVPAIALSNAQMMLANSKITCANPGVSCITETSGFLSASNVDVQPANGPWTVPLINVLGGVFRETGMGFRATVTGGEGTAVALAQDNPNHLIGPATWNGWSLSVPATAALGSYDNTNWQIYAARADPDGSLQVGSYSFAALTSGTSYDTAFGVGALANVTSAALSDSAFGRFALNGLTTGVNDAAFGAGSCPGLTSGSGTSCFGARAGEGATSSISSTFIGYSSCPAAGVGNGVTCLGASAGQNAVGDRNTLLGQGVAPSLTTGFDNVIIGTSADTDVPSAAETHYFNLNGWVTGHFGAEIRFSGAEYHANRTVTASFPFDLSMRTIKCVATTAACVGTLPACTDATHGATYGLKNAPASTQAVSLAAAPGDLIDGNPTLSAGAAGAPTVYVSCNEPGTWDAGSH